MDLKRWLRPKVGVFQKLIVPKVVRSCVIISRVPSWTTVMLLYRLYGLSVSRACIIEYDGRHERLCSSAIHAKSAAEKYVCFGIFSRAAEVRERKERAENIVPSK